MVIWTSIKPMTWSDVTKEFISSFVISDNFVENYVIVPTSSIVKLLYVFDDYEGDKKKKFCSLPKHQWARYFGGKIKVGGESNLQTPLNKIEVELDEESVVNGGDEESFFDTEDVDSFDRYNSSDESDDGYDTGRCDNNANKDSDGDILNQCGPAIKLYESQSEDGDKNDCGECDDETSL